MPPWKTFALLSCCAGFAPVLAHAADGDIIVTATGTEQPADDAGQTVSVIDRSDLERQQTLALTDALTTIPGVAVSRSGGIGQISSLFIRGANSEQTLVLIDGVRVNDPSAPAGGVNFGDLIAGPVARVEVLRGADSLVWGSQAIGGVVNIMTDPGGGALHGGAMASYGYADTRSASGWAAGALGTARLSLAAATLDSTGISAFDARLGGVERDLNHNISLSARADVPLGAGLALDLRGYTIASTVGIDGFPPPDYVLADTRATIHSTQWIGYAGLYGAWLNGRLTGRIAFTHFLDNRIEHDPDGAVFPGFDGTTPSAGHGIDQRIEAQGTYAPTHSVKLIVGAERDMPRYALSSYGAPAEYARAPLTSLYALAIISPVARLTVTGGLRHDDSSRFGGHDSVAGSAAWRIGDVAIVRASYGEGFAVPTLYELYGDYGNPALHPQTARSYDAGITLRAPGGGADVTVTWYRRDSRGLIDFVPCDATLAICAGGARPYGTYANIDAAVAQGVETALALRPSRRLDVAFAYTLTLTRDLTPGATYGQRLLRRPVDAASLVVDWRGPAGIALGATLRMVGAHRDADPNTGVSLRLAGYAVTDVRASLRITRTVELFGRVENLFGVAYEQVAGYGTYPRSAYGGLRLRFGPGA